MWYLRYPERSNRSDLILSHLAGVLENQLLTTESIVPATTLSSTVVVAKHWLPSWPRDDAPHVDT